MRRWVLIIPLVIGLGGILWFWLGSEWPLDEATELVTQGGDRILRQPMRKSRPGPNVLLIALDGVGEDEFRDSLRKGLLPRVAELLGPARGDELYAHGYMARGATTILPSTTMAVWASVYTGAPPSKTGVPGNEWFVREERRFVAPAPVSVDDFTHTVQMLTDGLVGKAVRRETLFERADVRSFVSLAPIYRGADLFTTPQPSKVAELFVQLARGLTRDGAIARQAYSEVDEEAVSHVLEKLERHGVPELQVVYFPGVDLFTHGADRPLEQQRRYLSDILDPQIARLLDLYEARGELNDTYVLFISDHGHTPVLHDDRHALSFGTESEPPALLQQIGYRVRPNTLELEEEQQDFQAVLAYQGAMAYVYLADRSTCERPGERCDWSRPPRLVEDVMPVLRAFHEANRTGARLPQLEGTLDIIFSRKPRPPGEDALPFEIFDGEGLTSIGAYLQQHPRLDLVRLEERMNGLSAGPQGHRAGDVLLLARSGMELPIEQRFYFAREYHSWHGSPTAQDSLVPFVLARQGDTGAQLRSLLQRVTLDTPTVLDVTPLVLELLKQGPAAPAR